MGRRPARPAPDRRWLIKIYASRVEAAASSNYGVPGGVISSSRFWGLETDFGPIPVTFPTIRSLATLLMIAGGRTSPRRILIAALRRWIAPTIDAGRHARRLGRRDRSDPVPARRPILKYAVDFDGSGPPRISSKRARTLLASTAKLSEKAWLAEGPAMGRRYPANFQGVLQWNSSQSIPRPSPFSASS